MNWEQRRKRKLAESLTDIDRCHVARRILLPVAPDILQQQADDLPVGISFEREKLTVTLGDTEKLFAHLFALAQAAVSDFEIIRGIAEL